MIRPRLHNILAIFSVTLLLMSPISAWAAIATESGEPPNLTSHPIGIICLVIFIIAYLMAISEEFTQLRKSKPVILAAGIIWALITYQYGEYGLNQIAVNAFRLYLLEFTELFLFILVAMTYVNAMEDRQVFMALRSWLVHRGCSYRVLFWIIGGLSFALSPVIDNLTVALLMSGLALAVGKDNPKFAGLSCIIIVVAVNAGGVFSPFGDIITLMVWQKNLLESQSFLLLLIPALVNFLVPATVMHYFVPTGKPHPYNRQIMMRRGASIIVLLFICTIATATIFHSLLHLPAMMGMMMGLAYLQFFGYYLKKTHIPSLANFEDSGLIGDVMPAKQRTPAPYDIFLRITRAEWDTLLFFYGVVICVGGLSFIGYFAIVSQASYIDLGITQTNILMGLISSIIDNIPMMLSVLAMQPEMSAEGWLLVTLSTGIGGSIFSIGSAAGVAVMGQARSIYTFFYHLKWAPIIVLGYAASILTHLWISSTIY